MRNPWAAIEKPDKDFNVMLVGAEHPLKLFWGVDTQQRYLFAYDAPFAGLPQKKSLPNLAGIEIYTVQQGGRGKLLLVLQDKANWELFHALCSDLVRATEKVADEHAASIIIVRRLQRWQELLGKVRSSLLSSEQIKGLIGELLFLKNPLSAVFGYDEAVTAWRGPEGAPQDFSVKDTAVEVKCQSGGTRPVVRISSADQLSPQLPNGYLVVYTLADQSGEDSGVVDLNSIVGEIRNSLTAAAATSRERFEDLLYMAGYIAREEYSDKKYSIVSVRCYKLAEGFPRIINSKLIPGVESVTYDVRLDRCADFQSKPAWWTVS